MEKKWTLNENPYAKWNHCGKDQEVEIALKLWFKNVCERDACVDSPLLCKKCFSCEGFLQPEEKAYAVVEELEKITSAPPDMTTQDFKAWMNINQNLETSAALIDHDIVEAVSNMNETSMSVSDEDEPENVIQEEKTPTSAEMRNVLQILWLGLQRKAEADGFHKHYE